jgi:hypothetical protein
MGDQWCHNQDTAVDGTSVNFVYQVLKASSPADDSGTGISYQNVAAPAWLFVMNPTLTGLEHVSVKFTVMGHRSAPGNITDRQETSMQSDLAWDGTRFAIKLADDIGIPMLTYHAGDDVPTENYYQFTVTVNDVPLANPVGDPTVFQYFPAQQGIPDGTCQGLGIVGP